MRHIRNGGEDHFDVCLGNEGTRDIQLHFKELYNYEISPETVSTITDKVMEQTKER